MGTQCLSSSYGKYYFYLKNEKILESKTTSAMAVAELRLEPNFLAKLLLKDFIVNLSQTTLGVLCTEGV